MANLVENLPFTMVGNKPYICVMEGGKAYKCSVLKRSDEKILVHYFGWNKSTVKSGVVHFDIFDGFELASVCR